MKYFHMIGQSFDPTPILEELKKNPLIWGQSLRVTFPGSPHRETEDIILRGPVGFDYKTLEELHQELACEDYDAAAVFSQTVLMASNLAYLLSSPEMRHLESPLRLGRVILTKLPPGKTIYMHKDEGPVPEFYRRFHLVVEGGPENIFMIEDETLPMQSGQMWECDVREMHTVINLMETDRVHLVVDIER